MKNWTRPKIKVQKFVPNFCEMTCYSNFFAGEAWVEDDFDNQYEKRDTFDVNDYYNSNWLASYNGKPYIKIDSSYADPAVYYYIPTGDKVPPRVNHPQDAYEWVEYNGLTQVYPEYHPGSYNYLFVITVDGTEQILARSINAS